MAGGYLAIGAAISAATSNQVIAFVVTLVVCFLLTAAGAPAVMDAFQGWAPATLVDVVSSLSFLSHFTAITAGVIDLRDGIFFLSMIGLFLYANVLIIDLTKSG
jgi:ABC-2 type transport system permease protein